MAVPDLQSMTLVELSSLIERRDASPEDVTRAYLERIDTLDGRLNAYITVAADEALAEARRAGDEIVKGRRRGPLHGLPIGLKDLFQTKGLRTTGGSKILADWVPDEDAHVVSLLRNAGAIVLGKLNMHEWAAGGTTINPHYGATRNPWDPERIPGGSSGGSGAAVAAGLCGAALGSDTAGSIRIPSSLCGIVGLKATYGLASLRGVLPLSWSLDHVGPMTRTVADCAVMMEAMAGPDPDDPHSAGRRVEGLSDGLGRGVRGLRIGLPRNHFFDNTDPDVEAAVRQAAKALEGEGARIVEIEVPAVERTQALGLAVLIGEAHAYHQGYLKERPGDYGQDVLALIKAGESISSADYINAQRARIDYARRLESVFADVAVLLSPTTVIPAATIESCLKEPATMILVQNTAPFNLAGLPALSLPCGFAYPEGAFASGEGGGLPIGLQIAGRRFDEATVLRVGAAYESATDWSKRTPPL